MEPSGGLMQVALSVGIQGFFVLFVWRLARKLYPFIDAVKNADPLSPAAERGRSANDRGDAPLG